MFKLDQLRKARTLFILSCAIFLCYIRGINALIHAFVVHISPPPDVESHVKEMGAFDMERKEPVNGSAR